MKSLSVSKLKLSKGLKQPTYPKNNNYNRIPSFPQSCIFVGESGHGKTNLISNLLTREEMLRFYFDRIYILTPNAKDPEYVTIKKRNEVYKRKYTRVKIIQEVDVELLGELHAKIDAEFKETQDDCPTKTLVLIDDFADEDSLMRSPILKKFFFNARHILCSIWISLQYVKAVPPAIRNNAMNYIIMGGQIEENIDNLKKILASGRFNRDIISEIIVDIDNKGKYGFLFVCKKKKPNEGRYIYNFEEMIRLS